MGDLRSPPPSVNVRYFERLAKKDFLKNLQTAYVAQRVALKHARTKSHFVRYFGLTSRNVHVIEQIARTLLPSDVVDLAEEQLDKRIETSMVLTDKATARTQALLQAEAITALPEYLQRPLEVEAKCISPKITHYLELILKADRLMTYLEALRLAGVIGTNVYDQQVAVVVRDLLAVARCSFHLAIALRKRADGEPAPTAKPARGSKGQHAKDDPAPELPASASADTAARGIDPARVAEAM